MITNLRIKNLRAFREIELSNLKRVNIVVGDSASGKTTLLEAIALLGGGRPDLPISLKQARTRQFPDPNRVAIELATFEMIRNPQLPIEVGCDADRGEGRSIRIAPKDGFSRLSCFNVQPNRDLPFDVTYEFPSNDAASFSASVVNNVVRLDPMSPLPIQFPPPLTPIFINTSEPSYELTGLFSELQQAGQLKTILQRVHREFPFIEDLYHGQDTLGNPIILARVCNEPKALPIYNISSGFVHWLRYSISLGYLPNIVFLIDELENGTYFGRYGALWKMLYEEASARNSQLFVTTHSRECLAGVLQVAGSKPSDFSLIQLAYDGSAVTATQIEGEQLCGALRNGFEVRGE
ncbi:MAG: AAA family ATPase [Armatimonadetes bacterium]|nr:AAA family ATPase [Armatimonadota bacterium]